MSHESLVPSVPVQAMKNVNDWGIIYTTQKILKEHFDIMIFIERYPLKRCQGCVKLIASKVNCFFKH